MDAKSGDILHNLDLIRAVRYLYRTEVILNDKDIVEATGYAKNTVSGYITGKVPASGKFRTKFEEVYNLDLSKFEEDKTNSNPQSPTLDENSALFLAGKLAAKEEVIQQVEARRLDVEANARKMEEHYQDMKAALERAQLAINDFLKPMAASLKDIPPVLDMIVRNSNEHDKEIMKALDRLEGNSPGTLEKESGKRILKGALEQQRKGKADVGKSGT